MSLCFYFVWCAPLWARERIEGLAHDRTLCSDTELYPQPSILDPDVFFKLSLFVLTWRNVKVVPTHGGTQHLCMYTLYNVWGGLTMSISAGVGFLWCQLSILLFFSAVKCTFKTYYLSSYQIHQNFLLLSTCHRGLLIAIPSFPHTAWPQRLVTTTVHSTSLSTV